MNTLREKNRPLYLALQKIKPILYLAPFAVGVIVFSLYPIVNVLLMSFKKNYKYLTGAYEGFGFDNYHPDDMRYTCIYAYDTWFNKPLIKKLMKNAITTDNSWAKSAATYLGVYKELVNRK